MPDKLLRSLILEDQPESQRWLAQALATAFPGIASEYAGSLREARAKLITAPAPDIAIIDLGLPDGSGVELIEQLNREAPATLCVVASIYDDDDHVFPALRAGASGYLLKDQPLEIIVEALRGIAAGNPPLSPAIARRMLGFFRPTALPAVAPALAAPIPEYLDLTERESEVLRYLAKGLTQGECARLMGLSAHTVVSYVKGIYRKLNVCSRAEAALVARDMGLV